MVDLRGFYQLIRNPWKSGKELQEIQDKKIRFIVNHAKQNFRCYKRLYKSIDITKIKGYSDLNKLPVITKDFLRKNFDWPAMNGKEYYSKIRNTRYLRTSGTTGIPLKIGFDKHTWDYLEGIYIRSLIGATHSPFDLLIRSHVTNYENTRLLMRLGIMRTKYVNVKLPLKTQVSKIKKEKNYTLLTYPTILQLIMDHCKEKNVALHPKRIISFGELLIKDMKAKMEKHFQTRIYNVYGTIETNFVAWECEKREGMHINLDSCALEIINKNQKGVGELILTNLVNKPMPIIRYEIGDLGKLKSEGCSCGRGLKMLKNLQGRQGDILRTEKGSIPPISIRPTLYNVKGIKQYQLIQESKNKINVKIVKEKGFEKENLINKLRNLLGNVKITIQEVDHIKTRTGKHKSIISRVKN